MHIIKDGQIVANSWRHLADEDEAGGDSFTVSVDRWRRERTALLNRAGPVGVRLSGADKPEDLGADLVRVPLIVLEFSSLRDGRSFSHARLLRERYGYTGEIRARGGFIRDQMFFLSRVGVNAFEFADERSLAAALPALSDFSVVYQHAAGDPARSANAIGRPAHPRY